MKTLAHLIMLLAFGVVMSLSGISSCRKNQPIDQSGYQNSPFTLDSTRANFPVHQHMPIPSTILLLGSGVAGMALLGWRSRTKR